MHYFFLHNAHDFYKNMYEKEKATPWICAKKLFHLLSYKKLAKELFHRKITVGKNIST